MYRIIRVLNNNALLVVDLAKKEEKILLGKGIGFGKKVDEVIQDAFNAKEYALTSGNKNKNTVNTIEPVYLEAAGMIIEKAESVFGYINREILLLLAEHIAFSARRLKENIHIDNPFISDIKAVFTREYMVAMDVKDKIERLCNYHMSEGEVGFIALHVHSGLVGEAVSETLRSTQIIDTCMQIIVGELECEILEESMTYSRLVSHLYYMLERVRTEEAVKVVLNSYIKEQYPSSYKIAQKVCNYIGDQLEKTIDEEEIGFLAIYVERLKIK